MKKLLLSLGTVAAVVTPVVAVVSCGAVDKVKTKFAEERAKHPMLDNALNKVSELGHKVQEKAKVFAQKTKTKYSDLKAGMAGAIVVLDDTAKTATITFDEKVVKLQEGLNRLPEGLEAAVKDVLSKAKSASFTGELTLTIKDKDEELNAFEVKINVAEDSETEWNAAVESIIVVADKTTDDKYVNEDWATKFDGAGDSYRVPQSLTEAVNMGEATIDGLSMSAELKKAKKATLLSATTIEEVQEMVQKITEIK